MRRRNIRLWSVVYLTVISTMLTIGADERTVFRIESKAVLVDFIVTDNDGNFISDLKPEEVQILEEGIPQQLRYFRLEQLSAGVNEEKVQDGSQPGFVPRMMPDPKSLMMEQRGPAPRIVFFIDLNAMYKGALQRVQRALTDYLDEEIPEGCEIMLAIAKDRLHIPFFFTTDTEEVKDAIDEIEPDVYQLAWTQDIADYKAEVDDMAGMVPSMAPALRAAVTKTAWDLYGSEMTKRQKPMINGMLALCSYLRTIPGRKNVVFYSCGYPVYSKDVLARITAAANEAYVSLYPVDARGLLYLNDPLSRRNWVHNYAMVPQEMLHQAAEETGGQTFFNSDNMLRGVTNALADQNQYYLASYSPSEAHRPGKMYKIDVRINRKGLKVRARKGFLEPKQEELNLREFRLAAQFPQLYPPMGLQTETDSNDQTLRVKIEAPVTQLVFTPRGEDWSCELEMVGFIRTAGETDPDALPLFIRDFSLNASQERMDKMKADMAAGVFFRTVLLEEEFSLPEEWDDERERELILLIRQKVTKQLATNICQLSRAKNQEILEQ